MSRLLPGLLLLLWLSVACSQELPTRVPTRKPLLLTPPPTPEVMQGTTHAPPLPTATATPAPTPVPVENPDFYLLAEPGVPAEIVAAAGQLASLDPQRYSWGSDTSVAEKTIQFILNDGAPLAHWDYAVAAPFATLVDDTTIAEITAGWKTGSNNLGSLIIDENTAATMTSLWGPPGPGSTVVAQDALVQALWAARPSWTIVPFQRLTPELKVLRLDGMSPLAADFNRSNYPLTVSIGLTGDPAGMAQIQSTWPGPQSNRDPGRLTTVAMSGVTALGRATAFQMEISGITTPGLVVGPVLEAADIAHISHEVPFATACPYPNPIGDPIFCARDGYLALIQSLGTDLIELTGNHVNDWGVENLVHSIELYEMAGMETFGGGRHLAEAKEAALFEHNGNRIAFVGCNPVGPAYAWATENGAGSNPCNYQEFYKQIRELKDSGYLVIATLQYSEFYHYAPTAQQQVDFRAVADAGAVAVSGSQGHHAQGFDLHNGAFIHYGLGNLFFDQMDMLGTRQSFIDTYTIYDGVLINVDLFTSLIENYCCPRAMSSAERQQLLQTVFQASGW
jgi:hypothetical protein